MQSFIKRHYLTKPFMGSEEIIQSETVFSQSMMSDPTFNRNFKDWFSFYDKNREKMHIFDVNTAWAQAAGDALEMLYEEMVQHVGYLLVHKTDEELATMFPMPGVPRATFLKFIQYARWTWKQGARKIGSRFDFGINEDGDLFVYEINADTPSMLFESMNVQNLMAEHLGDSEAQFNEIWNMSQENPFVSRDSVTAVVAFNAEGEDFGSTESIAQLAENAGGSVFFTTIADLQYDPKENNRSPFFLESLPHLELDNIYVMLPWEEMLASPMNIIDRWEIWKDCVNFFEPAWAWFLSHKALFAHLTGGATKSIVGMDEDETTSVHVMYTASLKPGHFNPALGAISKPMIGRKSSAIKLEHAGSVKQSQDQTYADTPVVYQPYRPTMLLDGARVMGTMWMYGEKAACLSFREFDGEILENENERVIMHRLV